MKYSKTIRILLLAAVLSLTMAMAGCNDRGANEGDGFNNNGSTSGATTSGGSTSGGSTSGGSTSGGSTSGGSTNNCTAPAANVCLLSRDGSGLVNVLLDDGNGPLAPIAANIGGKDKLVSVLTTLLENDNGSLGSIVHGLVQDGNLQQALKTLLLDDQNGLKTILPSLLSSIPDLAVDGAGGLLKALLTGANTPDCQAAIGTVCLVGQGQKAGVLDMLIGDDGYLGNTGLSQPQLVNILGQTLEGNGSLKDLVNGLFQQGHLVDGLKALLIGGVNGQPGLLEIVQDTVSDLPTGVVQTLGALLGVDNPNGLLNLSDLLNNLPLLGDVLDGLGNLVDDIPILGGILNPVPLMDLHNCTAPVGGICVASTKDNGLVNILLDDKNGPLAPLAANIGGRDQLVDTLTTLLKNDDGSLASVVRGFLKAGQKQAAIGALLFSNNGLSSALPDLLTSLPGLVTNGASDLLRALMTGANTPDCQSALGTVCLVGSDDKTGVLDMLIGQDGYLGNAGLSQPQLVDILGQTLQGNGSLKDLVDGLFRQGHLAEGLKALLIGGVDGKPGLLEITQDIVTDLPQGAVATLGQLLGLNNSNGLSSLTDLIDNLPLLSDVLGGLSGLIDDIPVLGPILQLHLLDTQNCQQSVAGVCVTSTQGNGLINLLAGNGNAPLAPLLGSLGGQSTLVDTVTQLLTRNNGALGSTVHDLIQDGQVDSALQALLFNDQSGLKTALPGLLNGLLPGLTSNGAGSLLSGLLTSTSSQDCQFGLGPVCLLGNGANTGVLGSLLGVGGILGNAGLSQSQLGNLLDQTLLNNLPLQNLVQGLFENGRLIEGLQSLLLGGDSIGTGLLGIDANGSGLLSNALAPLGTLLGIGNANGLSSLTELLDRLPVLGDLLSGQGLGGLTGQLPVLLNIFGTADLVDTQNCTAPVAGICVADNNGNGLINELLADGNGPLSPLLDDIGGKDKLTSILTNLLQNDNGSLGSIVEGLLRDGQLEQAIHTLLLDQQNGLRTILPSLLTSLPDVLVNDVGGLLNALLTGTDTSECQAAVGSVCLVGGSGRAGLLDILIGQGGYLNSIGLQQQQLVTILGNTLESGDGSLRGLVKGLFQEGQLAAGLQALLVGSDKNGYPGLLQTLPEVSVDLTKGVLSTLGQLLGISNAQSLGDILANLPLLGDLLGGILGGGSNDGGGILGGIL